MDGQEIIPQAYFDVLAIANDTPQSSQPLSVVEMHLFSYLACVLALFRGASIAQWGYTYAVTSDGFPFSGDFENARKSVVTAGLLVSDEEELLRPVQPELNDELKLVESFGAWTEERRSFLRTATDCTLVLPTGSIRFAVNRTAGIETPVKLGQKRLLLSRDEVDLLYDEYKVVGDALGPDADDQLSPAVLWLSAKVLRNEGADLEV